MPRPILFALLFALLAVCGRPATAPACSCIRMSADQYLAQADLVFLGRAEKKITRGDLSVQPFTVLHLIKGHAGSRFERVVKAGVHSTCHIEYTPGDVQVIFAIKGAIDLCAGNQGLFGQLANLGTYLAYHASPAKPLATPTATADGVSAAGVSAAGVGPIGVAPAGVAPSVQAPAVEATPVEASALAVAFTATLAHYLHDRPVVQVGFAPLAGTALTVGKTRLPFVAPGGKEDVQITRALAAGAVRLISGSYGPEGYSFDVLLLKRDAKSGDSSPAAFNVLKSFGSER